MLGKITIAVCSAMLLVICACGQTNNGTTTQTAATSSGDDVNVDNEVTSYAAMQLAGDMATAPEAPDAADTDVSAAVTAAVKDVRAKIDTNGDGKLSLDEITVFLKGLWAKAKADIDTNGDGVISDTERDAAIQKIHDAIAARKAALKVDWAARKAEVCAAIEQRVKDLGDKVSHHPLLDRVIAKCNGVDVDTSKSTVDDANQGDGTNNSGFICDKINQMIKSFGQNPPPGLVAIGQKCADGTFGKDGPWASQSSSQTSTSASTATSSQTATATK